MKTGLIHRPSQSVRAGRRQWLSRSGSLLTASALGMASASPIVRAQGATTANWPDRPVRFVVPFPPGGNSDALARVMADRLRDVLKANIVVENKPGGTTQVGTEQVFRAEPDGYTMLLATATSYTVLPNLRKLPWDGIGSFELVGGVADYVAIITARNELGVSTLPEFIALARKQPGKLTFGSAGQASAGHIYGEIIKRQTGIDMLHVPFKGSGELIAALGGGQIDLIIDGVGLGMARAGRAKALATFFHRRHPELPDVPALPETGLVVDLPAGGWGLAFPKGTPTAIVERVGKAAESVLAEPATLEKLLRASVVGGWVPPEQYRGGLDKARGYYGELFKAIGFKPES